MMRTVAVTPRTTLREITADDAACICELLNQPSFLRFIGDRQVRTPDDARVFIETRYRQSYHDHGYGLWVVERTADGAFAGICGFVRREALPHPDLGFALLPEFEGHGLAFEAAQAALHYARSTLGFLHVLAIATPDNARSLALLRRLGFRDDGSVTMPNESAPVSRMILDL